MKEEGGGGEGRVGKRRIRRGREWELFVMNAKGLNVMVVLGGV